MYPEGYIFQKVYYLITVKLTNLSYVNFNLAVISAVPREYNLVGTSLFNLEVGSFVILEICAVVMSPCIALTNLEDRKSTRPELQSL